MNVWMQANAQFLMKPLKTAVLSHVSLNLAQKLHQDVELKLFEHLIKFHPDQLKTALIRTLRPPAKAKVSESGTKWTKSMVPISTVGMKKIVEKFACNAQH